MELQQRESLGNLLLAEAYPRMAKNINEEAAKTLSGINFSKQFYAVAGNHVFQKPPKQALNDLDALIAQAAESEDEFLHIIQEYTRKSGATGHLGVHYKRPSRASVKAECDYDGDCSRVCDLLRTSIEVDSPEQIRKIANLLRPSNNSSVVRFENGFERPDEDSGMRRILCNIRLSNGHVCEIQVRHKGMEKAYESSEEDYLRVRAGRARLPHIDEKLMKMKSNDPDYRQLQEERNQVQALVDHHQQKRLSKHAKAAKKHGLDELVVDRTFNFINGFPVIHNISSDGQESTVIPDVETGRFVEDNRFLPMLTDKSKQVSRNTPRDSFMERAMSLVVSPMAKKFIELVDNTPTSGLGPNASYS